MNDYLYKIYNINDIDKFALVGINAKNNFFYSRIFAVIPRSNKIQFVATNENKIWQLHNPNGYRCLYNRLEKNWTCPINKKIINRTEALNIFPELKNIEIIVGTKK